MKGMNKEGVHFCMVAAFICCGVQPVLSKNFLLIGPLSISHQNELLSFGQGLLERGHQVYSAYPEGSHHANLAKTYRVNVIYYKADITADQKTKSQSHLYSNILFVEKNGMVLGNIFTEHIRTLCRAIMKDLEFKAEVDSLHFDLAIIDAFLLENCLLVVPHNLSIPFVAASPSLNPWDIGLPSFPSFTPNAILGYSHVMTFWQRIISFSATLFITSSFFPIIQDPKIIHDFAPGLKSQKELLQKAQMYIITRDHHLEWPAIQMPHVLTLPGISQRAAKHIHTRPLADVVQQSQALVIVSFGSTASGDMMPRLYRDKFMSAFQQFPNYTFLWQFDKEFLDDDDKNDFKTFKNVVLLKWLPQNDLLGHAKTKLFLTHCGNYGQYEAIYHGVPMLGFPLFAEQSHNAHRMQSHDFGLTIDIHDFTTEILIQKMQTMLTSDKYVSNLNRISRILKSKPLPYQEAAHALEIIAEFGSEHLLPATLTIPWYQVLMVDILVIFFLLLFSVLILIKFLIKFVLNHCKSKQKKLKCT